jgi:hypothetical protein
MAVVRGVFSATVPGGLVAACRVRAGIDLPRLPLAYCA